MGQVVALSLVTDGETEAEGEGLPHGNMISYGAARQGPVPLLTTAQTPAGLIVHPREQLGMDGG